MEDEGRVIVSRTFRDVPPLEVAWANLTVADKELQLDVFASASMAWLAVNSTSTYQDLEAELRKRNFVTHLIAVPNRFPAFPLRVPNKSNTQCVFECLTSCRPHPFAMKELLTHSTSYEENFAKLAVSGSVDMGSVVAETTEEHKQSDIVRISRNEALIDVAVITAEKFTEQIKAMCPTAELVLYGTAYDGAPVMVFAVGNTIVSDIGLLVRPDKTIPIKIPRE